MKISHRLAFLALAVSFLLGCSAGMTDTSPTTADALPATSGNGCPFRWSEPPQYGRGPSWPVNFHVREEFQRSWPTYCAWDPQGTGAKLCNAILSGDLADLRAQIAQDPALVRYVFDGFSAFEGMHPLAMAVWANQTEIARFLVEQGADVTASRGLAAYRRHGESFCAATPLHYAVANGNLELVQFLTARGAPVNPQWERPSNENDGRRFVPFCVYASPLHLAAYFQRNTEVVDALIALGADARAKVYYDDAYDPDWGYRGSRRYYDVLPLDIAASKDSVDSTRSSTVRSLIAAGSLPTPGKALQGAALVGDLDVVRLLLAAAPGVINSVSENGYTALHHAAQLGRAGITRYLLQAGADATIMAYRTTPFGSALLPGSCVDREADLAQVIEALLQAGASPSACITGPDNLCRSPLQRAASSGMAQTTSALIRGGADLATQGVPALKEALFVRCVLDWGVPLCGDSASLSRRFAAARVLTEAGVSANTPIPVQLVESRSQERSVEWLPLHVVSMYEAHVDLLASLLRSGADVRAVTPDQSRTALHFAVIFKNSAAIQILLAAGADITVRDAMGKTPFDYL